MKQMEYFEAGRKVPGADPNILYIDVLKMLPGTRNKMTVLGRATAKEMSNIPPQEFSSHSFSQHSSCAHYIQGIVLWPGNYSFCKDESRHHPKQSNLTSPLMGRIDIMNLI